MTVPSIRFFETVPWTVPPSSVTDPEPVFVIMRSPVTALRMREAGVEFPLLNVGGIEVQVHDLAAQRSVPFMAGELGLAVNQRNSAEVVTYLQELDSLLKGWGGGFGPGKCLALCWTSRVTRKSNDRLDASPAVLAEYRRMANDPFYGAAV